MSCASTSIPCRGWNGRRSWKSPRWRTTVLDDFKLTGWPKTSGKRGLHISVRIEPRWEFDEVRRAALALAREVERRAPKLATSKWWKEERHGVFVDYNQNAKDRTVASRLFSASHRRTRESRRRWPGTKCRIAIRRISPSPRCRRASRKSATGTPASMSTRVPSSRCSSYSSARALGDAPWPPQYKKQAGEPPRVQPSKQKKPLIEIGRAKRKEDALAGLERWKKRHPKAAAHLKPADVLVDAMRGRYSTWTRIRVNLQNVPAELRPAQEPLDPDETPR